MSAPELHGGDGTIRIPELRSVPLTRRVIEIIDHPAFQRLRGVRQLGPTHLVYPGAVHTRFEHSLGVFDMARRYLLALLRDPNVAASLPQRDIEACLLAALLHDLGHYPFAHSLEALHHKGLDTPRHEDLTARILLGEIPALVGDRSIAAIIDEHFACDPQDVVDLVTRKPHAQPTPMRRLVGSIISSGVDADKADYLERDSIHMGVSYGRNYDRARFLDALCVSPRGDRIAVGEKGKVAAEIFVFCRYTMFSEAYWHHTVRAVSAMVERALADYQDRERPELEDLTRELLSRPDDAFLTWLRERSPEGSQTHRLLGAVTSGRRRFFKRLLALSRVFDDIRHHNAYERIYHLGRPELALLREEIASMLGQKLNLRVTIDDVIIDTPPRDKDRLETVDVVYNEGGKRVARDLSSMSKVVQGIATDFIKVVKKIRIFVAPDVRAEIESRGLHDEVVAELFQVILDFRPESDAQRILL